MRDGTAAVCAEVHGGSSVSSEKKAKSRGIRKKRADWGRMVSVTLVPFWDCEDGRESKRSCMKCQVVRWDRFSGLQTRKVPRRLMAWPGGCDSNATNGCGWRDCGRGCELGRSISRRRPTGRE